MSKASNNYTRRGKRRTIMSFLSWFALGLALLLLAVGVWSYFGGDAGQWRKDLVGHRIPVLSSDNWKGPRIPVTHPALLYFFTEDCGWCDFARQELNDYFASRTGDLGLPVYAIAKPGFPDSLQAPRFHKGIRSVRLRSGDASLRFVRQVPDVRAYCIGRIDSAGVCGRCSGWGTPEATQVSLPYSQALSTGPWRAARKWRACHLLELEGVRRWSSEIAPA